MLDTSVFLLLGHLLLYIFLPLIVGIPFVFFVFGKKFSGVELYTISWFLGIGYATFFLYILQFFYFGVGTGEYFFSLITILLGFTLATRLRGEKIYEYIHNLKIPFSFSQLQKSYKQMHAYEKIGFYFFSIYIVLFLSIAFLYNASFPTYFDDTFGNWNLAALHIYFDGGFKIFGETGEILGYGGRVNYPIFINIFKALVANFIGGWYETYQNFYQYLSFIFICVFVIHMTYKKTKSLFYSVLPVFLICGMSLLFFHIIDGYMDLICGFYSLIVVYYLYMYLEKRKIHYFLLAMIFGILLINIKNDAFVVYLPGILIAFVVHIFLLGELKTITKDIFQKKYILSYIGAFLFFFTPPFFVRLYHGFALNPQSGDGHQSDSFFHPEIFNYVDDIFLKEDNFNLILLLVLLLFFYQKKGNIRFVLLAFSAIFCIFCLVFLFTSNYRWVLDQTTVNRVFLSTFFILVGFTGFIFERDHT